MEYFGSSRQSEPRGLHVPCLVTPSTEFPVNPGTFHKYPEKVGWKLHHDYMLEAHPGRTPAQDLVPFLQSWLIFGLASATLRVDGTPILQTVDLLRDRLLDTSELEPALRRWAHWEMNNPKGRLNRQVEIAYMLSTAKHVVRRNYGLDVLTKRVGHSTSQDELQNIPDELALLLMVLGERLSAVSKDIMDNTAKHTAVATDALDGGWGPSRWVLAQMKKDGWCPYDIQSAHVHFRSHASPLLSTYMTCERSTSFLVQHKECTEHVCRLKESQRLNGLHSSDCLPDCKIAYTGGCKITGPDMSVILDHLVDSSFCSRTKRWSGIPVLRFRSHLTDEPESVDLEVHRLVNGDVLFEQVVVISHAWNDGWGNDRLNKMTSCRLRFLQRMIQNIGNGRDLYFWLDTLIVPSAYEMDGRRDKAREKAISQVLEVFQHAKHTIVLDHTLPRSKTPSPPATVSMSFLSRAWMRRLCILQGMYASAEHSKTGQSSNSPESRSFLYEYMESRHGLGSLIRRYLTRKSGIRRHSTTNSMEKETTHPSEDWHTRGESTEEQQRSGSRKSTDCPIALVGNGWQVTKWAVSHPANLSFPSTGKHLGLLQSS